ncbi:MULTISPECIES: UPF0262 family protein [Methylobacterium]|uniref:UPF0262 protein AOPFMNJM_0489 n=1 Tax=Methylobacterium jeotgali TaxID=381630 RepID=A0ABQ4SPQ0_9HYPH|nr:MULTISPECIES: UPF0262 family protein [Methylobacterium]PIU06211.1 MAG: hypothetical protein COT56_10300 [Methylobacterium sp. CG09_land_8_20_14_0_10_71_15]PIU14502.1 MAG: hypothetical protein COT28_07565 [Methylobacterium sp. CG08_land_8_20_14_0_20_71_15]GBU19321.1 UPF0262 protein [Methylobacterium sp.]GJE05192.1 hypothetical protein AOPFMNJM_0489 [Methylobacterium jeotgali]
MSGAAEAKNEGSPGAKGNDRLVAVSLDEDSIGRGNLDQEHERAIAIFDILEENHFAIPGRDGGPYALRLGLVENKLSFAIATQAGEPVITHLLSLTPFRRVIRDYEMICESYFNAIRTASPTQIEAIDMGRRGVHNEAAETLKARLEGKIDVDYDTARRLFTLVFALHWKG